MPTILPPLIYFIGAILALFLNGRARFLTNIVAALTVFVSLVFFTEPQISHLYPFLGQEIILFNANRTSLFMSYIFSFMALLVSIYSMQLKERIYHVLSMLYVGCAMGMVFADDLISFYIFGEIMLVSATALICYKKDEQAVKASFRYFLMHFIGSSFLLAGILINYLETGSIRIDGIAPGLPSVLILIGIGVNAAFIPLHSWLPDAYSKAPFAVSLLLSVFTTKSAVYALARMFAGLDVVGYMGAMMALFGVVMALLQSDARKLLSYHVISQVGFMVAGVGLGTFFGIDGALYHAFNNILYKSLFFMCIGAVIYRTGKQDLSELGGFARGMPITTIACIIAALSISGVPLFNGYASKAILYEASYKSALLLWTLKLASLGTFISFSKFTYYGFLRSKDVKIREAPANMTLPMVVLAFLCIASGIYPKFIIALLPYYTDLPLYVPSKVVDALVFTTASGVIFFLGMKSLFRPHGDTGQGLRGRHGTSFFVALIRNPGHTIRMQILSKVFNLQLVQLFSRKAQARVASLERSVSVNKAIFWLVATMAFLLLTSLTM